MSHLQIDAIFHCAAWVNVILPYEVLRGANVQATIELTRLALTGKRSKKQFHYVSTLSAITPFFHREGFASEMIGPTHSSRAIIRMSGYPLTKYVSEVFLSKITEVIPDWMVTIYRPGTIAGHSKTGHFNLEAFVNKYICGMIQLGYHPYSKKYNMGFDVVPVDQVAQMIVYLSRYCVHSIYHVNHFYGTHALSMDQLIYFVNSLGYDVRNEKYCDWKQRLFASFETTDNVLKPLKGYFLDGYPSESNADCRNSISLLRENKEIFERIRPIQKNIVQAWLGYAARHQYIPTL